MGSKPEVFSEVFSAISRLINAVSGGTADLTLCARAGRDDLVIRPWIDWVFAKIANEPNHCATCWERHNELVRKSLNHWIEKKKKDEQE